jgi:O-acetylhomoserine (thiol)-lyase
MNPTQMVLEARLQSLEGGTDTAIGLPGALAVASGQAAETLAILNLAEAGDHIVASASLYGGTYNLLHYTFPKMGIETTFISNPDDLDAWAAAIRPNTKAFYGETIGNLRNDCLDLEGISALAHGNDIPLIVNNTVASPYLMNPLALGADIVVHSMTKFIGGHGNSIGASSSTVAPSTTAQAEGSPTSSTRTPATTDLPTGLPWDTAPTSSRPGCSC